MRITTKQQFQNNRESPQTSWLLAIDRLPQISGRGVKTKEKKHHKLILYFGQQKWSLALVSVTYLKLQSKDRYDLKPHQYTGCFNPTTHICFHVKLRHTASINHVIGRVTSSFSSELK